MEKPIYRKATGILPSSRKQEQCISFMRSYVDVYEGSPVQNAYDAAKRQRHDGEGAVKELLSRNELLLVSLGGKEWLYTATAKQKIHPKMTQQIYDVIKKRRYVTETALAEHIRRPIKVVRLPLHELVSKQLVREVTVDGKTRYEDSTRLVNPPVKHEFVGKKGSKLPPQKMKPIKRNERQLLNDVFDFCSVIQKSDSKKK